MNLRQLRYFVQVVEAGNMTRAAEQLHVAQPALGLQIRQLEEDLGVALLVRHSRGIMPTRAGNILHQQALAILQLVEETKRLVVASDDATPEPLRLGLTPSLMHLIGSDIAVEVRERIPDVALSLVEHMSHLLHEALADDKVDVILAYDVPDSPHLSRTAVYQEDLVLVSLPGGAPAGPVPLAEVLEQRLALPEPGDSVRNNVARIASEFGRELVVAYEVRSIAAIKNLIARGAAHGILPMGTVLDEVRAGSLAARPIVDPPIRRTLFLAFSRKHPPLRCKALTALIREAVVILAHAVGTLGHPLQRP